MILPWDAERMEREARERDAEMVGGAARPYLSAARDIRSGLTTAMTAANPTRGAAGSREAAIAAAPEMARLASAGADATNAARTQAAANMYERDRARSESASQILGMGLNAAGAVGGMLSSALGGGGSAPGGAAPGVGPLLGAAAPVAGTALGGPLGGMAGGALGSAIGGGAAPAPPRMASALAPPAAAPLGGYVPGTRRDVPLGGAVPGARIDAPRSATAPVVVPAAPPLLGAPSGLGGLPGSGPMTEEEMRRLGLLGGR